MNKDVCIIGFCVQRVEKVGQTLSGPHGISYDNTTLCLIANAMVVHKREREVLWDMFEFCCPKSGTRTNQFLPTVYFL